MCRYSYLDSSASAVAESAAREEHHKGYQQQQPEQRANTYPASNGSNYKNNQNQLQEPHTTLLYVEMLLSKPFKRERESVLSSGTL